MESISKFRINLGSITLDIWDIILILTLFTNFIIYLYLLITTYNSIIPYNAYDKGIMYQLVYNTIGNGQPFLSTINGAFDLTGSRYILALMMPLFFIFPHPSTFSVISTALLTLGALPVYWLARDNFQSKKIGIFFTFSYFLYPAVSWLYMENVKEEIFVLPLLLFAFYFMEKKSFNFSMVFLFLACICKMNITFIAVMFGVYALLQCYERKWIFVPVVMGIGILILELFLLQPLFSQVGVHLFGDILKTAVSGGLPDDRYPYLGKTVIEILLNGILKQGLVFDHIFRIVNLNYLVLLLLPFLFISLVKPKVLIIGIPVFFQNFLAEKVALQQISFHYVSVLTFVVISSAVLALAQLYKSHYSFDKKITKFLFAGIAVALVVTFILFGAVPKTLGDIAISNTSDTRSFFVELEKIPKNSSVLCTQNMGPYFYQHPYVEYINPDIKGGFLARHPKFSPTFDYVVLDKRDLPWPSMTSEQYGVFAQLFNSSSYSVINGGNGQIVLKKVKTISEIPVEYKKKAIFFERPGEFQLFIDGLADIIKSESQNAGLTLKKQWNIEYIGFAFQPGESSNSKIASLIDSLQLIPVDRNGTYSVYRIPDETRQTSMSMDDNEWQLEKSGDTRWRWLSNNATLPINAEKAGTYRLSFNAHSVRGNRTLQILLDDKVVDSLPILERENVNEVQLTLNQGKNNLTFFVKEGCEQASDLDPRCLSISISDISLQKSDSSAPGIYLQDNWYQVEMEGTVPAQWMSNSGSFIIFSPSVQTSILSFNATSFNRPRLIKIISNGNIVTEQKIGLNYTEVAFPVTFNSGKNVITLFSIDNCEKPSEIPELQNNDPRCLSIKVKNAKISPLSSYYGVKFIAADIPSELSTKKSYIAPVTIQNTGKSTWSTQDIQPVHLSYHWLKNGSTFINDGARTELLENITTGQQVQVQALIKTPADEGDYTLVFDLVKERAFWFENTGSNNLSKAIHITNGTGANALSYKTEYSEINFLNNLINTTISQSSISFEGSSGRINGFYAGSGYPQVWVRDSATIIPVSRFYYNPSSTQSWIEEFLVQQFSDGGIYDFISPGVSGKNTVETDQESSLVHSAYLYVKNTGDKEWLNKKVKGETVVMHLDDALSYVLTNRYNTSFGLVTGAYTADWGDVQFEDVPGTQISNKTHFTCDIYDNSMFVRASDEMATMYDLMGETGRSNYWKNISASIKNNVNLYLWQENKGFYMMHIPLSDVKLHFIDSDIFAMGGNVMAIEAGIADESKSKQIFSAAEIAKTKANATSIGISLYPSYPKGFFANPIMDDLYEYQNGGTWDWFGGRLVLQEFEKGYSKNALLHLREIARTDERSKNFYEWFSLNGTGAGSPNYTGSAGVMGQSIIEGYYGIYLSSDSLILKPRIGMGNAKIDLNDSGTGKRVSYDYSVVDNSSIALQYWTNANTVRSVELLIPEGRSVSSVMIEGQPIITMQYRHGDDSYLVIPVNNLKEGRILISLT